MRVSVIRKNVKFTPDSSRVVARYFMNGDERTQKILSRLMEMDENKSIRLWSTRFVNLPIVIAIFRVSFLNIAPTSRES